jgi:hypothetical protein
LNIVIVAASTKIHLNLTLTNHHIAGGVKTANQLQSVKYQKVIKMWRLNTALRGFTVGRVYKALAENNFNVALRNDVGDVQYVEKRFLVEVT